MQETHSKIIDATRRRPLLTQPLEFIPAMGPSRFSRVGLTLLLGCVLPSLVASTQAAGIAPAELRCECAVDPLGIDVARPRLSWIVKATDPGSRGQMQMAYQILVADDSAAIEQDKGNCWDTGKVESDETVHIEYAGTPLRSSGQYWWKARVWDKAGQASPWSKPQRWSMGLLKPDEWRAKWIRFPQEPAPAAAASQPVHRETLAPSPWLRKSFSLEAAPRRAMAYVNVLGYFELYVNGQKVGSDVLSPAVSDYQARSFYVTYDIAPLLRKGPNCIGLWLGRGWHVAGQSGVKASGPVARFHCDILTDNKNLDVISDETWKCAPSPYATLGPWQWDQYGGERYDARLENAAWNTAEFDDRAWTAVQVVAPPASRCESQRCPLNRIGRRIPAVSCSDLGGGRVEVDFGTNLAGWLRMRLPLLPAGHRVAIHYADQRYASAAPEKLPPGVTYHTSDETFDSAKGKVRYQTFHHADEFLSAGRPGETFCSKFNYHGFRYAVIEGLPTTPDAKDFEALLIESDLEPTGQFTCSNELLNRIRDLNLWTVRCLNLGGYMVDCPHRERLGYGDGQVSAETCLMNFWMPNFYAKWLGDWRDGQNPKNGSLRAVAPRDIPGGEPPGWGGTMAAIAWRTYLYYGDRRLLEQYHEPMRRYVDFLESRCVDGILRASGGQWDFLGDWVPPGRGMDTLNWPSARANEFFNNCYRVYLWELLEKSAAALGRDDEVQRCRAKLDQIRPLIHRAFYDPDKHSYGFDEQAYQCFPLLTGVTPPAEREAVMRTLQDGILIRRGGHLDSGMLGTYFLIQYLSAAGRDDLLYTIVNQKTYPGWGHMLQRGATTMWEQWNGYYSQIHSCYTSIAGWFHNDLAGIQPDAAAPGFKKIVLRPAVVGDLASVRGSYDSIRGPIRSDWSVKDKTFDWTIDVPANTTATAYVPASDAKTVREGDVPAAEASGVKFLRMEGNRAVFAVESGRYHFRSTLP